MIAYAQTSIANVCQQLQPLQHPLLAMREIAACVVVESPQPGALDTPQPRGSEHHRSATPKTFERTSSHLPVRSIRGRIASANKLMRIVDEQRGHRTCFEPAPDKYRRRVD